jgi:AraC-like DNA-binding protein
MEHQLEVMEKDQELKDQQLRKRKLIIFSVSTGLFLTLAFSGLIVWQLIKKRMAYNKLMEKNLQLIKCNKPALSKQKAKPNNKTPIDPELQMQIQKKLRYQINHNKIFLKSDLSLNALARKCQTNSSYLSKIIHIEYNTNFSGFINELRIKEAQKMMGDDNFRSYSIEGIASSVGFKTKSVFNASFKKFTGVTPSYYLEYLQKSQVSAHVK